MKKIHFAHAVYALPIIFGCIFLQGCSPPAQDVATTQNESHDSRQQVDLIIAGDYVVSMEKVRPGTGRETGLSHVGTST